MLVLSRRVKERIVIGFGSETVTIELLKVMGQRARLGVDAPSCVAVHREELWEKVAAKNEPGTTPAVAATYKGAAKTRHGGFWVG